MLYGYIWFNCIHKTDNIFKDITEDVADTSNTTLQIMNQNSISKNKNKKSNWINENELGRKCMAKLVGLRAIKDDAHRDRKLKFENYKKSLEKTQLENKINYLQENKIDIDSIKRFIKIIKSIVIIKRESLVIRLKSERHNVFTEKINNITLSLNDDKKMQ